MGQPRSGDGAGRVIGRRAAHLPGLEQASERAGTPLTAACDDGFEVAGARDALMNNAQAGAR
jgi:hypothetical protein